jgi:predicted MFS family arabinose efflux permease
MQMAAQSWLVYDLTDSSIWLGLVGASGTAPMLLFSLPAGVVADRFSKRNILLVTQSVAMLQAFALAALTYFGVIRVWHVMVLAALLGISNSFDMPARHSMVIELSSRKDVLNAVSLNSSAFNSGRIVGPALGGLLIASVGTATCFFINGISFVATIVALAGIAPREPRPEAKGPMLLQIQGGLRWAKGQPLVKALLAMIAAASVFAMSYATLLPVFARDVFHMGAQAYGFLLSSYAVGALTSALLLTALGHRWPLGRLIGTGSYWFPFALAAVALAPRYGLAVAALFLAGVGLMLFNATTNTMLQRLSPDELRGRVMSMRTLLFAGMMPLGAMQMGALGEWLGPRAAVGIGAAVCLVAAITVSCRVPGLRQSE